MNCTENYDSCIYYKNGLCKNKDRIINEYGCQSDITEEDLYEMQMEWNSEYDEGEDS